MPDGTAGRGQTIGDPALSWQCSPTLADEAPIRVRALRINLRIKSCWTPRGKCRIMSRALTWSWSLTHPPALSGRLPPRTLLVVRQLVAQATDHIPVLDGSQFERLALGLNGIVLPAHFAIDGAQYVVTLPVPPAGNFDGFLNLRNGIGEASPLCQRGRKFVAHGRRLGLQ